MARRKKAAKKADADEATDVQKFNPGSGPATYPAEDPTEGGSLAERDITEFNPGSGEATWPAADAGGTTTTSKLPKSAKK